MTHFENADIGVSFDLPDNPTALDVIRYDSTRLEMAGEPAIVILWECVKPLLKNWNCDVMPDYKVSLDKVDNGLAAAQAVEFAAFRGSEWRLGLDTVPKN